MYDMMLGPCGNQYWAGSYLGVPNAMPQSRFHMDWSRVAFPAAAQIDPLHAFSYSIGTQQPAAITAAIGASQADIFDTSITQESTVSKTCLLTHMGISLDDVALMVGQGGDVASTLAATRVALSRLIIRAFWAERSNEETAGSLIDFPDGRGFRVFNPTAAAYNGATNGVAMLSNVKPLPRPLPCKGGDTYFRTTFEPSVRDGGATFATVTSFTTRVYGVAPAKIQPSEAPSRAMQALAALQAQG